MNLQKLSESLLENQAILDDRTVSIKIEHLPLEEQKEAINYFKDGKVKLNFFTADKVTDRSFVHVCLVKGGIELNAGMCYVPALRKSSPRRKGSGFAQLMSMLIEDVMRPKSSETLKRDNKSMLLYALTLFPNLESYELINSYSYRNVKIPEAYDTVEKCLDAFDLEQYQQFKIA